VYVLWRGVGEGSTRLGGGGGEREVEWVQFVTLLSEPFITDDLF